uniref:Cnidarian restricted protein n=2 Tax=Clytia hemisphaerica TaxID=252671 RepID=A0A7M5VCZ9_9CNID
MMLTYFLIFALTIIQHVTCTENNKKIRVCLQRCRHSTKNIPKFRNCIHRNCFRSVTKSGARITEAITATETTPTMPATEKMVATTETTPTMPATERMVTTTETTPTIPASERIVTTIEMTPTIPATERIVTSTETTPTIPASERMVTTTETTPTISATERIVNNWSHALQVPKEITATSRIVQRCLLTTILRPSVIEIDGESINFIYEKVVSICFY